jgi:hypothetical protein
MQTEPLLNRSEKTQEQLQRIEKDCATLSVFLSCFFTHIGKHNNPKERPTSALKFLAESTYPLNEGVPLGHMPATEYITKVILPTKNLDSDFATKLAECNDNKNTWSWFSAHFKEQIFKTVIADYKKTIA